MKKPSFIKEDYIPINGFSRTGHARPDTMWIDLHWIGKAGQTAFGVREYFESLGGQDPDDDERDVYAGANFIVDYASQTTLEAVPVHEVTYTAGAAEYTNWAHEMMGTYFTSNAPVTKDEYGWHGHTPNWLTVSIEMCHPGASGEFEPETLAMAAQTCAWLIMFYRLVGATAVITHNMITGKVCPKWWVDRPHEFERFKSMVSASLELNE